MKQLLLYIFWLVREQWGKKAKYIMDKNKGKGEELKIKERKQKRKNEQGRNR